MPRKRPKTQADLVEVPEFQPLWVTDDERSQFLENIHKEKPQVDRLQALLGLRSQAMVPELRDQIWDDEEVRLALTNLTRGPDPKAPRKSLYSDGPEIPDEAVRTVALGIVNQLQASASLCTRMGRDADLTEGVLMGTTVLDAAGNVQTSFLRHRSWMALTGIALAGGCAGKFVIEERPGEGSNVVCDGLLFGVDMSLPETTRAETFGTIWSMALAHEVDVAALWTYERLRKAVVANALIDAPLAVRENAMGLLWALATSDFNQPNMWADRPTREAVVLGIPPTWQPKLKEEEEMDEMDKMLADSESEGDEDEEADDEIEPQPQPTNLRIRALRTVECWASEPELRHEMWMYRPLAIALMGAAEKEEPLAVRSTALQVLLALGLCYANHLHMFGAEVQDIFTDAEADEELPEKLRYSCRCSAERIEEGAAWAAWEAAAEVTEKLHGPEQPAEKAAAEAAASEAPAS